MSKDVIIAGALAVGCVALIAAAFLLPKSKPAEETVPTDVVTTETLPSDPLAVPLTPVGNEAGTAAFSAPGLPGAVPSVSTLSPSPAFPAAPGMPTSGASPASPFPTTTAHQPFGAAPAGGDLGASLPAPAPVIEAPLPAPAAAEPKTHTVANGELLGDIALKYYGSSKSWKKIAAANPGVDPKHLKVGQKLIIPVDDAKSAAPAVAAAGGGDRTYTVKPGDTYYSIAKRELGSAGRWKEIKSLNGKSGNDLRVGAVIKLPGSAGAPSDSGSAAAPAATTGGTTHTVGKGETLADISRKYFGSTKQWKKIVDANPGVSPERLKIGQKLVIPTGDGAGAATASATAGAGEDYVVQPGDTPRTIALKLLGSKNKAQAIIDANPGINPNNLRVGQKLKIPGGSAAAPAPASAPSLPAPGAAFPAATPSPAFPASNPGAAFPAAAPGTAFPAATPGAASPEANPFQAAPSDFSSPYAAPAAASPSQPSPFGAEPVR